MEVIQVSSTADIFQDVRLIIEQTQKHAYQAVNVAMIQRNWLLGKRIADEELKGENRAEYGKEIVKNLSEYLTDEYGKGFTKSNLTSVRYKNPHGIRVIRRAIFDGVKERIVISGW